MATVAAPIAEQAAPELIERLPAGTPEKMQKAFNRRVSQLTAKRRAAEERLQQATKDLMETVAIAKQLLERSKDRVSRADLVAIRKGLEEIEGEYGTCRS